AGTVANRDGSGIHVIYYGSPGNPEWSSDGKWIGFMRSGPGFEDLMAIQPDGSGVHVVAANVNGLNGYDWSPDDSRLVFLKFGPSQGGDSHPEVYTVPIAGGEPTQLTNDSRLYKTDPHWSPNGHASPTLPKHPTARAVRTCSSSARGSVAPPRAISARVGCRGGRRTAV